MGKFYGCSPSRYVGIDPGELHMIAAIDYACLIAYFVDENWHYKESQKTAQSEAGAIGNVLEDYREQLNSRG